LDGGGVLAVLVVVMVAALAVAVAVVIALTFLLLLLLLLLLLPLALLSLQDRRLAEIMLSGLSFPPILELQSMGAVAMKVVAVSAEMLLLTAVGVESKATLRLFKALLLVLQVLLVA
jgi:hypothetical protein